MHASTLKGLISHCRTLWGATSSYAKTGILLVLFTLAISNLCFAQSGGNGVKHPSFPPKLGVQEHDIQIPLSKLVPEATFTIGGSPDWIAIDRDVWVSNKPKNLVSRIDPRENKISQTIEGFHKPCSGLAVGFGSLWVPNCGNQTLARVDLKTGDIMKEIPVGIADSEGGLSVGANSVWLLTDKKSTLARIDPVTNSVAATIALPEGCYNAAFGFDSVWVTCTKQNTTVRVDPKTNAVISTISVGPLPRFLSVGEGSIWTLNQGDGSVTRISPKTNQVEATIQLGIPGEGGDISVGEGSVWATAMGYPVTRIDPKTNKVMQQFVGDGGDAIRAGGGMVILSNYKSGIEWRLNPKTMEQIKAR